MALTKEKRKVAIITGGASGIGRALAAELARRDVEVVIADRQAAQAQEVARAIVARGGSAYAAEVDVRSFDAVRRVVEETVARADRLDYMFNNAGIGVAGLIETYSISDWDDVFDVNLRGVVHGVQAAYPIMIAQGFGHIINTASIAGLVVSVGMGSYTASKFAVVGLSRALRAEAKHHGVRISVLCPGIIRTPILNGGKYGRIKSGGLSHESQARRFERMRPIPPEQFARKAIEAVMRDVAVAVIPSRWKMLWYLERFFPDLTLSLSARVLVGMRREIALATKAGA